MNNIPEHGFMARKLIVGAIACAVMLPSMAQAVEFKISGQVSRMLVAPDDADGDELQNQDIGFSGSRFRITGSSELDNGVTVGFRFERQAQSNPSTASTGGAQVDGDPDDAVDNRYQDIYFSGGFGKIALGKGDGAANGNTEADLSGTILSSSSNHQDNWGNYRYAPTIPAVPDTPGLPGSGSEEVIFTWDSIFTMADGLSRVNRLRYDTPSFNGVTVAFSADQGNATEIGIRYKNSWNGNRIDLRAFSADTEDFPGGPGADSELTGYSGSLLFSNGFNITIAGSDTDRDTAPDRDAFTVKLGYKTGYHAFTIDYGEGETGSDEADTVGLTYASVVHPGVDLFVTIRELDTDVSGAESIDLVAIGSRVKF